MSELNTDAVTLAGLAAGVGRTADELQSAWRHSEPHRALPHLGALLDDVAADDALRRAHGQLDEHASSMVGRLLDGLREDVDRLYLAAAEHQHADEMVAAQLADRLPRGLR
jgi:hypothetical protein